MKPTLFLKATIVATTLLLLPFAGHAAKKPKPISEADAAALAGKTAAVTLHKPSTFVAATPGKAAFALLGVAGMVKAGSDFVEDNGIEDPAVLLRTQLGALLHEVHGLNVQPADTTITSEKKAAKLASLHPESDIVLSVRSIGWNYSYDVKALNKYWLGYAAEVQLIDAKSGRQLSEMTCGANTVSNPIKPTLAELRADRGQLAKDIFSGLGWLCVQLLAKEQFRIPADKIPAIPAEYVNPIARLQPATGTPDTAPAAAAPAETTSEAATSAEPTAEPATATEPPTADVPAARTP